MKRNQRNFLETGTSKFLIVSSPYVLRGSRGVAHVFWNPGTDTSVG